MSFGAIQVVYNKCPYQPSEWEILTRSEAKPVFIVNSKSNTTKTWRWWLSSFKVMPMADSIWKANTNINIKQEKWKQNYVRIQSIYTFPTQTTYLQRRHFSLKMPKDLSMASWWQPTPTGNTSQFTAYVADTLSRLLDTHTNTKTVHNGTAIHSALEDLN